MKKSIKVVLFDDIKINQCYLLNPQPRQSFCNNTSYAASSNDTNLQPSKLLLFRYPPRGNCSFEFFPKAWCRYEPIIKCNFKSFLANDAHGFAPDPLVPTRCHFLP